DAHPGRWPAWLRHGRPHAGPDSARLAHAGAAVHGPPADARSTRRGSCPHHWRSQMKVIARYVAALGFAATLGVSAPALAQGGPPQQVLPEGIRGGSEVVPEKGVEIRKYVFTETGEELPYSVFVSSKVRKDQKAPLIIALRG